MILLLKYNYFEMGVQVNNISACFQINKQLNLDDLIKSDVRFQKSKRKLILSQKRNSRGGYVWIERGFPFIVLKVKTEGMERNVTALINKTGKINFVGCRCDADISMAVNYVLTELDASLIGQVTITNYAASYDFLFNLPFELLIDKLTSDYYVSYDPEIISSMICTPKGPKLMKEKKKILLYHTGNVVYTGFRSFTELEAIHEKIFDIILSTLLDQ